MKVIPVRTLPAYHETRQFQSTKSRTINLIHNLSTASTTGIAFPQRMVKSLSM